jgi:hypothetical protein
MSTNPPPASDVTPTTGARVFNEGDKMRQIRRRMRYLEQKVSVNGRRSVAAVAAECGEWLALHWAVSVIVEKYPDLRRPEDDRPVPAHMERPSCRAPAAPK